jgi:hypothetical protein
MHHLADTLSKQQGERWGFTPDPTREVTSLDPAPAEITKAVNRHFSPLLKKNSPV